MRLVEDQEIDLADLHKCIEQGLIEDFSCAHDDHVFHELFIPGLLVPEIGSHGPKDMCHILIKVVSEYSSLLKNKSHTVNLDSVSIKLHCSSKVALPRRMPREGLFHLHDRSARIVGCVLEAVLQSVSFQILARLSVYNCMAHSWWGQIVPVSSTAIVFRVFARSKSSIW